MDDLFPALRTMKLADALTALPELAAAVSRREERVVLEQDGEPVAVVMSLQDLERILEIQRARIALLEFQDRATEAFAGVPEEELLAETERMINGLRSARHVSSDLAATG